MWNATTYTCVMVKQIQTCVLYESKQIGIAIYDIKLGNCKHYNKVITYSYIHEISYITYYSRFTFSRLTFITKKLSRLQVYSVLVFVVTKICQKPFVVAK